MPQPIRQAMSYSAIAQFASMGLQFGSSIVLTRQLGAEQYGLYGIFFNWVATVGILGDMGVSSAITKYIAEYEAVDNTASIYSVLSSSLVLHGVIVSLLWIFFALIAPFASNIWFDGDLWLYILFILSFSLQIWVADLTGALYGLRELKVVAFRLVIQSGILLGLTILLVWVLGMGLHVAAGIYTGTLLLLLLWLLHYFAGLVHTGRLSINRSLDLKQIVKFALPISGIYPIQSLIRFMPVLLVKLLGTGQTMVNQDVAFLSLALLLGSVVNGVLSAIIKSGYGYMSRWHVQGSIEAPRKYLTLMQVLILVSYGGVITLGLIGLPLFIKTVYGEAYLGASSYIVLTLVVTFTTTLAILYNTALYAMALTSVSLQANIVEFILYMSLVIIVYLTVDVADWGTTLLIIATTTGGIKAINLMVRYIRAFKRNSALLSVQVSTAQTIIEA